AAASSPTPRPATRSARPRPRRTRSSRPPRSPAASPTGPRGSPAPVRVLLIDNYDSFTYNLVQYLGELGAELDVVRNDAATVDDLVERGADRAVVSPGPGTPADGGVSVELIPRLAERGVPVLGVCLGLQSLAVAYGGRVVRGDPIHGKPAEVEHDGRTIFRGLES